MDHWLDHWMAQQTEVELEQPTEINLVKKKVIRSEYNLAIHLVET